MRVIIDNNLSRLYGQIANGISQSSKMTTATSVLATSIILINAAGLAETEPVIIGEIGCERTELTYIQSITGQTITISPALTRSYDNKTRVYRLDYDSVLFFEGASCIGSKAIGGDHYVSLSATINQSLTYSATLYNTQNTSQTAVESVWGYDRLLCASEDMRAYEKDITTYGVNIIAKMELARDEIRRKMLAQDYDIDDLDNPSELRMPAAILACSYCFKEMVKTKEDWASLKLDEAKTDYLAKITTVFETLEDANDEINLVGQSRCDR